MTGERPVTGPIDRLNAALTGRYNVEREIGAGGMATVYLAEDLRHHRKVAVKVLRPELAATLGSERFLHEIEIAAQLQHPNILPLLDSGDAGGFLFYVMPFVDGPSLRQRLVNQGALSVHDAVRILLEIVDALAEAHEKGIVHRDMKPDNVLLTGRHAVITDFGVAKAVGEATGRHALTTAGVALGTPTYMAPEQAAADPGVDHRADIYAVGVMAYEMLTGKTPFEGTAPAILAAHVTAVPTPVTSHRATVPPGLATVVMRCLEKKPADRWQSAAELLPQLEALAVTPTGGITPTDTRPIPAVPRNSRRAAIAAALVGIAVLTLLWSFANRPEPFSLGLTSRVTTDEGLELDPALSPDGRFVAYAAGPIGRTSIYVRQLTESKPIIISEGVPGRHRVPRWSPDGNSIAFSSFTSDSSTIFSVPAFGGSPRRIASGSASLGVNSPAWSPDGREIAYATKRTLCVVPAVGGPCHVAASGTDLHSVAWSPDGSRIAFVAGNSVFVFGTFDFGNLLPSVVVVVPARGGQPVQVTDSTSLNVSPVWIGNQSILFISNRGGGRDLYLTAVGAREIPVRVTNGINAHSVSASSNDGRVAYTQFSAYANIWTLPIRGRSETDLSSARRLTAGTELIERLALSRDGGWLAYNSDRNGNSDIFAVRTSGDSRPRQLTSSPGDDFAPAFSPSGREVAYFGFRDGGKARLLVTPAEGGAEERVATWESDDWRPDWSPTGDSLVFESESGGIRQLKVVARSGQGWGTPKILTTDEGRYPRWSPDGRWIAYLRNTGTEILIVDPREGHPVTLVRTLTLADRPHVITCAWSPDSRILYFNASEETGGSSFWSVTVPSGQAKPVARFNEPVKGFATDGSSFYFTRAVFESDIWTAEVKQ